MLCYRCKTLEVIYVSIYTINVVSEQGHKAEYRRQKEKQIVKAKPMYIPLVPAATFILVTGNLMSLWHRTAATINTVDHDVLEQPFPNPCVQFPVTSSTLHCGK